MDLTTTAFAPIATSSAIVISPIIFAPVPINTLFPITGALLLPLVVPIFTHYCNLQFFPIFALEFTTIVP